MTSEQETLRSGMEDTQLTQNNSPAAGPVVAKTSDGLHLSVQTYGQVGNDEILFIHGFGQSRLSWSNRPPAL
jgi:pimeloyl-ACP methyl ester carboxylesterase